LRISNFLKYDTDYKYIVNYLKNTTFFINIISIVTDFAIDFSFALLSRGTLM